MRIIENYKGDKGPVWKNTGEYLYSGKEAPARKVVEQVIPQSCKDCEYHLDRGLDYPKMCELLVNAQGQPCPKTYQQALLTGKHPHPECLWNATKNEGYTNAEED